MCGITGWFDMAGRRLPSRSLLSAMNEAVAHRGPDGEGIYAVPGVGLAHRRLAIIDLAAGKQPMLDADGHLAITFNGEIYNFRELRKELEGLGHCFRTRSDTEVILLAWKQWGEDCLARLEGMFAFALYDAREELLFLARDRLGEKPLYYSILPDRSLIFSSELGGLLVHPGLKRDIDPHAVEEYFTLGYVLEPRTIYASVFKLQPGFCIVLHRSRKMRTYRYWDIKRDPSQVASLEEAAEGVRARLKAAVARQMVSDVPIGSFLSGGIDSGLTTAFMAQNSPDPIRCFTIGFRESCFDESGLAAMVAGRYGASHRIERLTGLEDRLADGLARIAGEPFGDSSILPSLRLMRLAREQVTVALSGDGGDELFAGYRRYQFHVREERMRGYLPSVMRALAFGALGNIYPQLDWAPRWLRARQTFRELAEDRVGGYLANISITDDGLRQGLFTPALRHELQGYHTRERMKAFFDQAPFDDPLAQAQYVDLKTWLPGDILVKVDRTAMSCGLEVRVPMLDAGLVQWALNLPGKFKLGKGSGKAALKRAAQGVLPDALLSRPKQGFSVPLAAWFRGAMGRSFETDLVRQDGIAASGTLDVAGIRRLLEQHRSGLRDHSRSLWLCWMFAKFMQEVHFAAPAHAGAQSGEVRPIAVSGIG